MKPSTRQIRNERKQNTYSVGLFVDWCSKSLGLIKLMLVQPHPVTVSYFKVNSPKVHLQYYTLCVIWNNFISVKQTHIIFFYSILYLTKSQMSSYVFERQSNRSNLYLADAELMDSETDLVRVRVSVCLASASAKYSKPWWLWIIISNMRIKTPAASVNLK